MSNEVMVPSSDDIETGPTSNLPDKGWHDAEVIQIVPSESSRGNPMMQVEWQIDNGEYEGYDGLTQYHEFGADHGLGEERWCETIENAPQVDGWEAAPFSQFCEQFFDKTIRNGLRIDYRWVIKEGGDYNEVPKEKFEDYDGHGETRVYPEITDHREPSGEPDTSGVDLEADEDAFDGWDENGEDEDALSPSDDDPF